MEKMQHKYLDVRGLKLHVAEVGTGLLLKFLVDLGVFLFLFIDVQVTCFLNLSRSCCAFHSWISRDLVLMEASDDRCS